MNNFIKKAGALIISLSFCVTAFADYDEDGERVLTPPIWMAQDMLLDNENVPKAQNDIMHSENEMGFVEAYQGKQKFTNLVDGYSIVTPNMKADMSLSDVCVTFTDNFRSIRIFKEVFDSVAERNSYLNYSNKFLENTTDHQLVKKESFSEGEREYHILQWSRKQLSGIRNDKNYYTCIDVCEGARCYTIFFASSKPFLQENDHVTIAKSLITFDPSVPYANAYNRGYKKSSLSHLNQTALASYNNFFAEDASFKMGMFAPDKFGGNERLEQFENKLGYRFSAILIYTEVTDKNGMYSPAYSTKVQSYMNKVKTHFDYARSTGKAIELTLQTPLSRNTSQNMIYEILNGEYDTFINAYAKLIASNSDVTVLFRPFNEMNGDWCNYSAFHTSRDPEIYVQLYRYIHQKFSNAGCKNIIWVWNPNERSFPNFKWNHQDLYYPGDEYVDVYGITGYNTGNYYEGERWRSFDEIYAPIYERALRINEKPIMITEFSCSAIGGDKLEWIEDMFISLPKYDKIKMAIWWHATDYDGENLSRPYFMDTPEGTLDIFDKYLN